jgi:alanyl-tRNA synthetase
VPIEKIMPELEKRLSCAKELEKQLNIQNVNSLKKSIDSLIRSAKIINNIKVITEVIENLDIDLLRKNADLVKEKTDNCIVALGSKTRERALLVIAITGDLCLKGWDASKLIKDIAKLIGGSGGGRADFAQAGGRGSLENLQKAFEELKSVIAKF